MTTIVFLHIPKTAGQTVHSELARIVGEKNVSPVRVHTQATPQTQFPSGFALYSGHIDWIALDDVPEDRFVFSVLRDPRERIASFYLYLLKEAQALGPKELEQPTNTGKRTILRQSADDYFFSGPPNWQKFIHDHYDNFYCSYFATKRMRGWVQREKLEPDVVMRRALRHARSLDAIYSVENLAPLEVDIERVTGKPISVTRKFVNAGSAPTDKKRWPLLIERIESDANIARLEAFAERDAEFRAKLGF